MSAWTRERHKAARAGYAAAVDGLSDNDFWMENNPDEASSLIFTDLPGALDEIERLEAELDDVYGEISALQQALGVDQ